MTEIRLHNTRTRKKEVFAPIDPDNVRMYVCGPTVYDRAHLGNARPVVVFDVLYRLLRHVYGENHVTYVRNFTDVDDKINARALENVGAGGDVNAEIKRITEMTTQWFLDDMHALGALDPNQMPRATAYIPQMIEMIDKLVNDGFAYAKDGHVLFRVREYADYGALSGRSVDDMIAGARVEVAPYKEDPMDFVLWKPSSDDLPGWDSPWGRGRPGWHIECSAMSYALLGASFDIHGGGNDLMFPHHENEIAQSCCAHPEGGFANVWLHNEMLQVEGKKMSKSLGNFFTVHDLLEQGIPGEVIRFVFLSTHYRKPMDWTEKKREEAEKTLRKIVEFLGRDRQTKPWSLPLASPPKEFVEALANDLNTSLALTLINKYLKNEQEPELVAALEFLGFYPGNLVDTFNQFELIASDNGAASGYQMSYLGVTHDVADTLILLGNRLFEVRRQAMETKDFSGVDALKSALLEAGVEVRMSKDRVDLHPAAGFDPAKLEALK
ncbi:cysteine--tRNA ligase [Actibacterium sp. XHP0104]|uniref:cysteine--tRNA ligase n=1 Tax=Actibacterium sp. XHP0104 TaxID=2984335 RepID=UPI0021E91E00|nr:cysteine--tRNA ligase [Actibacterium sp. XHP0104]MCV2881191.1 cysteine--tRNA ligase [Actibacterium sp. XHP0104]